MRALWSARQNCSHNVLQKVRRIRHFSECSMGRWIDACWFASAQYVQSVATECLFNRRPCLSFVRLKTLNPCCHRMDRTLMNSRSPPSLFPTPNHNLLCNVCCHSGMMILSQTYYTMFWQLKGEDEALSCSFSVCHRVFSFVAFMFTKGCNIAMVEEDTFPLLANFVGFR